MIFKRALKRLKKGEQDSPWASPLANYWTLARLDPLCKAGGKQQEEKKKEQMAVRGKKDIYIWVSKKKVSEGWLKKAWR